MSTLKFNRPQLLLAMAQQPEKYLEGSRGIGKSSSLAWEKKEVVTDMPRSNNVLVGETYQQILTRTLPSTLAALERLGIYRDKHYFIGRRAPRKLNWRIPIAAPGDFSRTIHYWTGAVYNLVSQDRPDSGRGLNSDSVIGDEMTLLKYDKLATNVLLTCRGSAPEFKTCRKYRNKLFVGTVPLLQSGRWVYKKEQDALLYPKKVLYIRANARENVDVLGEEWFRDMKRDLPQYLYDAEIENIRPTMIDDGFYPLLSENHFYTQFNNDYLDTVFNTGYDVSSIDCRADADCNTHQPLELSVDWGSSINCLVVCQQDQDEFRFINSFYVKSPKILDHVFIEQFIPYYQHHRNKRIILWYDRNGNSKLANSKLTFAEQAQKILREAGWEVELMSRGLDPYHQDKYMLWNVLLAEKSTRLPVIRFNRSKCKHVIISMQNAPASDIKGIQKVKKSERKKDFPQEEATHFSDAADIIVYGKFRPIMDGKVTFIDNIYI